MTVRHCFALIFRFVSMSSFDLSIVENDIGKATWLIPKLQVAFRDAFEILSKCVSNDNPVSDKAPT